MTFALLLAVVGALPCDSLDTARQELTQLSSDPPALAARVHEWSAALEVTLASEAELTGALASELSGRIAGRLTSACALRATSSPAQRTKLTEILSREEFADSRGSAWGIFGEWLASWLRRFLVSTGVVSFAEVTRVVVLVFAFAIVIAGALRVWSGRRRGSRDKREGPARDPGLPLLASPEHLAKARAVLEHSPREALRETWLALLSELERKRLARPDRVRTNRELAAELPRRGAPEEVSARVQTLVREFDAAYYSLAEVPLELARRFLQDVEKLQGELAGNER